MKTEEIERQFERLPKSLKAELANPPAEGEGLHRWIFEAALKISENIHDAETVIFILISKIAGSRANQAELEREIRDAAYNSQRMIRDGGRATSSSQRIHLNKRKLEELALNGATEANFIRLSPKKWADPAPHTE